MTLFLKKKEKERAPKFSPHPIQSSFLSVLCQIKALHSFHKRGQQPINEYISMNELKISLEACFLRAAIKFLCCDVCFYKLFLISENKSTEYLTSLIQKMII